MGTAIIDHDAIRRRAYEIWEAEGRPEGRDQEHWIRAQRELCEQSGLCVGDLQPLPTRHVQGRLPD